MTAGLPGVGIGGIFYVVSALLMPVRAAVLTARGRRADARWGLALRQAGIAAGILGALWATGWAIAAVLDRVAPSLLATGVGARGGTTVHNVVKVSALALSLLTLTIVVGVVQVARLVVARPDARARAAARRGARAAAILGLAAAGAAVPRATAAQRPAAVAHLAAGDSAYRREQWERADTAYAAALASDSSLSRAWYQLAMLRRHRDPSGSLRLLEGYVRLEPRDAWGWAALGDLQRRAGRSRAAVSSWERAIALDATAVDARRFAALRASIAATVEPLGNGAWDSDGNAQAGGGIRVTSPELGAGTRLWVQGEAKRISGADSAVRSMVARVGLQGRPLPALRLEANLGVAQLPDVAAIPAPVTAPGPGRGQGTPTPGAATGPAASGAVMVGQGRLRWRAPSGVASLDLRGGRTLLDVTPALAGARAWRDEIGGEAELRIVGSLRGRGFARTGRIVTAFDRNTRQVAGGAAVLALSNGLEVGARGQQIRFGAPTTAGYFAPDHMRVVEATSYLERETSSGIALAVDLGAGAQQVTDWNAPASGWTPAAHGWAQLVLPVGIGRSLGLEVDAYDAKVGTEGVAPTTGRWRYGSASLWLRVALQ